MEQSIHFNDAKGYIEDLDLARDIKVAYPNVSGPYGWGRDEWEAGRSLMDIMQDIEEEG